MAYRYSVRKGVERIKTKTFFVISGAVMGVIGLAMAVALPLGAKAASTVVVTPANQQGWSTADTRPGGNVTFVNDATSPAPNGALRLTTDTTNAAKAQYLHSTNTPIGSVTELSYYTKQNSASFLGGDPSYQFIVCLTGINSSGGCNPNLAPTASAPTGFTSFVYEPYQGGQGVVVPGAWQQWNINSTGLFWSSKSVTCSGGSFLAGAGGTEIYTLSDIQAWCPEAVAIGFGVNIGSFNPSYDVETDLVSFNGTAYNFEQAAQAVTLTNKDQCKDGGWMTSNNPTFKNQGDCVSFFATKGKNGANGSSSYTHFTYGSATLSSPTQQINFSGVDNGISASDQGSFTYTNTTPALNYTAQLTCVNVVGNTAYMAYVIPSGNPYSGTWVVWKVVDNATDTAGFTTAPDMASANALCEAGSASVTNYAIVAGDVVVQ